MTRALSVLAILCIPSVALAQLWPTENVPAGEIGGPPLSWEGLEYLGYIQPRSSLEISGSPWGIQAGTLDPDLLRKAAEIGVKWTRLHASWDDIEKEKGEYDWEELDRGVEGVLEVGITPFVTIGHGNPLYTPMTPREPVELYGVDPAAPVVSEEAMQAWLGFVERVVERYEDRVKYWEIWNEPNHPGYWRPDPNPRDYARLVVPTATLIRRIDPEAKIIAGSTAGIDEEFIGGFLEAGAADLIDVVTFHNYTDIVEERLYEYEPLWAIVRKNNPDLELWQGETGYPSYSSTTGSRRRAPWGLNIQAKWLLRQALTDVFLGEIGMTNYFLLWSGGDRCEHQERPPKTRVDSILGYPERGGSRVRGSGVNEKALLHSPTREPKPGFYAYQNLAALLDDRYQRHPVPATVTVKEQGDFYGTAYGDDVFPSVPIVASFRTDGGDYLLGYWLPWKMQEHIVHPAHVELRVEGANFEDPVLVNPLSGRVYEIENARREGGAVIVPDLPMADWPFFVAERDQVEIVPERDFGGE